MVVWRWLSVFIGKSQKDIFNPTSSQIVQNTHNTNENELCLVQKALVGTSLWSNWCAGWPVVLLGWFWLFSVVLGSYKVVSTQTNNESLQSRQEEKEYESVSSKSASWSCRMSCSAESRLCSWSVKKEAEVHFG